MDKKTKDVILLPDTMEQLLSCGFLKAIIIFMLTLGCLIPVSETCSCVFGHPQDYFCRADFVIKARVRSAKPLNSDRSNVDYMRYTIRLIKTLKANEAFRYANKTYLYTPASGTSCGMGFQLKQKYLISGTVSGSKLHTELCDYNGRWHSLTKWQRRGFTSLYNDICDCKVQVCFHDNCYQKNMIENRENMCILDVHRDRDLCYMKHSRCSRRENGECRWNRTGDFKRCRAESKKKAWEEP